MTLIWTLIVVPTTWLHASISCLYKKGARNIGANYRGLSIGANMSRIIAKVITERLNNSYEKPISHSQFGFRSNRSTTDGIFILNTVVEKYSSPLIALYIDLTAAYNHIPRDFLFRVIQMRTGAHHLVAIPRKMYEGTSASIKGMDTKFNVLVGCRQGGRNHPSSSNITSTMSSKWQQMQ